MLNYENKDDMAMVSIATSFLAMFAILLLKLLLLKLGLIYRPFKGNNFSFQGSMENTWSAANGWVDKSYSSTSLELITPSVKIVCSALTNMELPPLPDVALGDSLVLISRGKEAHINPFISIED